jgi:hypothetical protein
MQLTSPLMPLTFPVMPLTFPVMQLTSPLMPLTSPVMQLTSPLMPLTFPVMSLTFPVIFWRQASHGSSELCPQYSFPPFRIANCRLTRSIIPVSIIHRLPVSPSSKHSLKASPRKIKEREAIDYIQAQQ